MILKEEREVSARDCDTKLDLSWDSVVDIYMDGVTDLFSNLGFDGTIIVKTFGASWVVVKNKMLFFRLPYWRERYVTECFITHVSGAKIQVDMAFSSKETGEMLAYGRGELCALNMETGRPHKVGGVIVDQTKYTHPERTTVEFEKYGKSELPLMYKRKSSYMDIDYLHHTNNVAYIRMALDAKDTAYWEAHPLTSLETHYVKQSHEGDLLSVEMDDDGYYNIRNEAGEIVVQGHAAHL
jgi:acyl-CoA thioesterase FadM